MTNATQTAAAANTTNPKHTPGPWTSAAEVQQFDLGESITIYAETTPRVPVATVLNADDFPCCVDEDVETLDMEAQANARLIAAAPDLLNACSTALIFCETAAKDAVDAEYERLVVTPLRAAIAKATEGKE